MQNCAGKEWVDGSRQRWWRRRAACGDSCLPVPMIDYYQENHTLIKNHNHLRRAEPKPRELIFDSPNFAWSLIGGPLILLEAFFVWCNKIQTWAFRFNRLLHILPCQLLSARNDGETTRPCGILLRRCCGRSLCHTSLRRHTLDAHTDTHTHTHRHTQTHTDTHTDTKTHRHTDTNTHISAYTHTHKHSHTD